MVTRTPVRPASLEDIDAIGGALGAAFEADPVLNWLVRDDHLREWAIETMMRELSRHRYVPKGGALMAEDGAGAAVWVPPGSLDEEDIPELEEIFVEVVGPKGFDNIGALGKALDGKHPTDPHYYLFAIGVRPTLQSQGLGARLMAPVLEKADAERMPAYLESSNERNHTFYFRHGFEIVEQVDLPGGPSMWLMWRDPQ